MYLPSNIATCSQGPLPAGYNAGAAAAGNLLTGLIDRAQSAFDAAVDRLDLGPNGMPWGSGPMGATEFGLGTPPLNITWPGINGPGAGYNPNPAGGTGAVTYNGQGGSNPRVVDYPHCSPVSLAAQFSPPQRTDDCVTGAVNGYVYSPIPIAAPPTPLPPAPPIPHPPPIAVTIPNPRTPPVLTGDVCVDLQSGALLQSNVPMEKVYACSQAGYVGVGPSGLPIVREDLGLNGLGGYGGLGSCGDPNVCAGNPHATPSPADRARAGNNMPGWAWAALLAAGIYAVTQNGNGNGNTNRKGKR